MATFTEVLESTGLPEAFLAPAIKRLTEAEELITLNNIRVSQINAAKANDPSRPGFEDELDKLWKLHAPSDENMAPVMEQFDVISETYESLLKQLREFGKTKVPTPLSEDQTRDMKKLVNDSAPTIAAAIAAAKGMAEMIDGLLVSMGKGIEGGIVSLLPDVEPLKQMRGRKAGTSESGTTYMTKTNEILVDGNSTNRDGKGKANFAADFISKKFNADRFPDNKVTAEELEDALFAQLGKPHRSVPSTELPDETEFDFTKTIKVQNANDDSTTDIPETVKIVWKKYTRPVAAKAEDKPETSTTDTPAANTTTDKPNAPTNSETENKPADSKPATPETLKVSDHVKPETVKAEVPAKKVAAPAAKPATK